MNERERVTARTYRTAGGKVETEYLIDGLTLSSAEAVERLMELR